MEELTSKKKLIQELDTRPGLIPYTVDPDSFEVTWIDFEKYHFYEGFSRESLNRFNALKALKSSVVSLKTNLSILEDDEILGEYIYPSAFIFHASRCGSTLLTKVFARSRKNLVLSEYSAHNLILLALTKNGTMSLETEEINRRIYRNLFLATVRKRLDSHQNCIIKFTSYNIFFYDFIRSIFPDVPAVFLYRKPSGILASIEKGPMGWIEAKDPNIRKLRTRVSEKDYKSLDQRSYINRIISELFSAALKADDKRLFHFNFKDLKAKNLQLILDMFGLNFLEEDLKSMSSQFNYYSKSENKLVKFTEKKIGELTENEETYQEKVSPELRILYEKLVQKESAQRAVK